MAAPKVVLTRAEELARVFVSEMPESVEWYFTGPFRLRAARVECLEVLVVADDVSLSPTLVGSGFALPASVEWSRRAESYAAGWLGPEDDGVPVRVQTCPIRERATRLLHLTGPPALWEAQRSIAKRAGYVLEPDGFFTERGVRLEVGSEEEIYRTLNMIWLQADARGPFGSVLGEETEVRHIPSSSGRETYTVRVRGRNGHCTCKGFKYSKTCKHVRGLRAELGITLPLIPSEGL